MASSCCRRRTPFRRRFLQPLAARRAISARVFTAGPAGAARIVAVKGLLLPGSPCPAPKARAALALVRL